MKNSSTAHKAIVIGAGIVGLSTAFALQQRGVEVTVVDRIGPAAGASWGNAGWLSPAFTIPLPEPALLKQGPRALLSPSSPVALVPSTDPAVARFMAAFALNCTPHKWGESMRTYAKLNAHIFSSYERQIAAGVRGEVLARDMTAGFASLHDAAAILDELARVSAAGQRIDVTLLDPESAREYEPHLTENVALAVRLRGQRYMDPGAYVRALADAVLAGGGELRTLVDVTDVRADGTRVRVIGSGMDELTDAAVLCSGAWLPALAAAHGVKIPLFAGRGYSCSVPIDTPLRGATYFPAARAAITPRPDGADGRPRVRVAGIMEFADPDRPLNPKRIRVTNDAVRPLLRGIDWSGIDEQWVGSRPLSADGLPLIGGTATPGVYVGGGHGMWGLTLGPLTGELLAEQITTGRAPALTAGLDPLR